MAGLKYLPYYNANELLEQDSGLLSTHLCHCMCRALSVEAGRVNHNFISIGS